MIATAHLFPCLHVALMALRRGLDAEAWNAPTVAGPWRVRDVARGQGDRTPVSFAVVDQADSTVSVTVRYDDGEDAAATLRRGGDWAGDYFCDDGWFALRLDGGQSRWDEYARPDGHTAKRRTLRIAPAPDGALIARLDAHWFEGFQPYAPGSGDGIPLPWTWTSAHAWLRTEAFSEAALARLRARGPGARLADATSEAGEAEEAAEAPVSRENEALENPPPSRETRAIERRVRALVLPGVRVLAVAPRDSGWHVSVAYTERSSMVRFLLRLQESLPARSVWQDPLVRGRTEAGEDTGALFVVTAP
jgi:hypothetical protein